MLELNRHSGEGRAFAAAGRTCRDASIVQRQLVIKVWCERAARRRASGCWSEARSDMKSLHCCC